LSGLSDCKTGPSILLCKIVLFISYHEL
jgi:hypothetical protein